MTKLKILTLILSLFLASTGGNSYAQDEEVEEFSKAELDQILAPIALYPDTLLSHILIAATYPLEVIQAERWSKENDGLEGDAALTAVEAKDWDPSVKALAAFPTILEKMSEDLGWTQKIGDAFLQDEELVLASVQDLRQRAYDEGSLKHLDHFEVVEDEDNNIVIESKEKEVVYVPYYDTRVVYGNWWWHDYPPVYWSGFHTGISFYWGPRIFVGTGIYFSSFHWRNRHVVVVDRRHHNRHRFYSGRHVSRHIDSRRWAHNPRHRRGVYYRSAAVRDRHDYRVRRDNAVRQNRNTRATADSVSRRLSERRSLGASSRDAVRGPLSGTSSRDMVRQPLTSGNRNTTANQRSTNNRDASRADQARSDRNANRTNASQQSNQSRDASTKSRKETKYLGPIKRAPQTNVSASRSTSSNHVNNSQRTAVKTDKQQRQYRQEKSSKYSNTKSYKSSNRSSTKATRSSSGSSSRSARSSRSSSKSSRNDYRSR